MLHFPLWKRALILVLCVFGVAFTLPNFFSPAQRSSWPTFLPHKSLNLGLDLRGGSYVLMGVDESSLMVSRLNLEKGRIVRILREAKIRPPFIRVGQKDSSIYLDGVRPGHRKRIADLLKKKMGSKGFGGVLSGGGQDPTFNISVRGSDVVLSLTERSRAHIIHQAVLESIEIIRRRIDELGTNEPIIEPQGHSHILIEVPGLSDPSRLISLIGKTAKLTLHLVDDSMSASQAMQTGIPFSDEILYMRQSTDAEPASSPRGKESAQEEQKEREAVSKEKPMPILVKKHVALDGSHLISAQPTFDPKAHTPIVSFRLDTEGGRIFAGLTRRYVGKQLAIVLDHDVVSAPVIQTAILDGAGTINGNFTVQEANNLAILLRAGRLPARLNVLEQRTVGASLGADSVHAGFIASIVGLVVVIFFMFISYGLFGLFADLALIINMMLLMAVLSALQATLTLPGIAGIVLTLGMAVDANVLIFERIREEAKRGRSVVMAIETGYKRAWMTILDANLTTLIAALILFEFGSGPVRGFAVTLSIGVVTSVFTAFTVSRLFVSAWYARRRPRTLNL